MLERTVRSEVTVFWREMTVSGGVGWLCLAIEGHPRASLETQNGQPRNWTDDWHHELWKEQAVGLVINYVISKTV